MAGQQAMGGAKRVTTFEADMTDPRFVIIGVHQTARYGKGDCEQTRRHPCFDRNILKPHAENDALQDKLRRLRMFGYDQSKPIDVWKDGEFFLLRDGRNRLTAGQIISAERGSPMRATFFVSKGTETGAFVAKVNANAGRRFAPTEEAELMVSARTLYGLTDEERVVLFEKPIEVIQRREKLLDLTESLRRRVDDPNGGLTLRVAEELSALARDEQEARLLEMIELGLVSQEDQRRALRQMSKPGPDGARVTARDVVLVQPRPVLRKLADRILDGTLKVPGIERMKVAGVESKLGPEHYFALGMRMATGQINPRQVGGLVAALREVSPKRREKQLAAQEGDAEGASDDDEQGDDD
jgi:hypothetical protein